MIYKKKSKKILLPLTKPKPWEKLPVIYIDSECILCNRVALFIQQHSNTGEFYFSSLQKHFLMSLQLSTIVVKFKGNTYTEGEAVLFIVNRMHSFYRWMGKCLSLIPLSIIDKLYRVVARSRYRLWGKTPSCYFPKGIDTEYFLDQ